MLQLFEQMDSGMEIALAVSVPLISGIAELIGLDRKSTRLNSSHAR